MNPQTKDELLQILAEMAIHMPKATTLSYAELVRRLERALYSAQLLDQLLPYVHKLHELPLMPFGDTPADEQIDGQIAGPTQIAMEDGLIGETSLLGETRRVEKEFLPSASPTRAIGNILNCLARLWDMGMTCLVISDEQLERRFNIPIRILSVRQTEYGIPLVSLLFFYFTPTYRRAEGIAWVHDKFHEAGHVQHLPASAPEVLLFLRLLLMMNRRYLPPDFIPAKDHTEQNFESSFSFPISPLSCDEIIELRPGNVCIICEEKGSARCAACDSVLYCSRACQRAHWKEHKQICENIKGGTWHTVRFATAADLKGDGSCHSAHDTEPNLYGQILRISYPAADNAALRIMDRHYSLYAWLREVDAPDVFSRLCSDLAAADVVRGDSGEAIIFRWARRMSDWEVKICVDRDAPDDRVVLPEEERLRRERLSFGV